MQRHLFLRSGRRRPPGPRLASPRQQRVPADDPGKPAAAAPQGERVPVCSRPAPTRVAQLLLYALRRARWRPPPSVPGQPWQPSGLLGLPAAAGSSTPLRRPAKPSAAPERSLQLPGPALPQRPRRCFQPGLSAPRPLQVRPEDPPRAFERPRPELLVHRRPPFRPPHLYAQKHARILLSTRHSAAPMRGPGLRQGGALKPSPSDPAHQSAPGFLQTAARGAPDVPSGWPRSGPRELPGHRPAPSRMLR
mmetsp:Transcript_30888/g.67640  ORF Transcript_30888/g.67640 Transcript_30888/m.67640 type:complete len:249 (-) Transcript_30888:245-991(-)